MSKWRRTGTVPVIPRVVPVEVVPPQDERSRSSWDSAVAHTPPRYTPGAHDERVRRLANKRDTCLTCGALTGQRCQDLAKLPARVFLRMFHRGRLMLPPAPPVERMTRLSGRKTDRCRCGCIRGEHHNRSGPCKANGTPAKKGAKAPKHSCRSFRPELTLVGGKTNGTKRKKAKA